MQTPIDEQEAVCRTPPDHRVVSGKRLVQSSYEGMVMGIRGGAALAGFALALLLAACGGGSGRQGTDIVVTGSGPTGQILRGDSVTFQMTVANVGDGDANDVAIRGSVAYPLVQDSITCNASGNVSCPASLVSPMSVSSLPPGSSLAFQITAHLANGGTGTVPVAATMSATTSTDYDNTNNTATVNASAYYSAAGVKVTGLAPGGTVAGGSPAQFVMTVSNAGPDAATNLSIRDIPESISQASIACSATGQAVCPTSLNAHGDPMTVDQLNVGDSLQFTVTGTAPASPRGQTLSIGNKMSVVLDNDSDTSDNSVDVLGTAYTAESGVYAAGAGPTAPVPAGSTVNFTMTVGNAGPDAASNLQVRDSVDSSLVATGVSCQAAGNAVCPDLSAQPFQGGALPVGGTLTFNVGAQVKTGYSGTFHNTLAVASGNDSNTADNTATAQGTAYAEDLKVTGTAPSGPIASGSVATFTMTVTNSGPGTATDVAITDTTSANLTLGTITCQAAGGATCPSPTGASMSAPSIPSGGTLTFSVAATVQAGASGAVTNTMTASALGESKPADNSATATVNALSADLAVSETAASTTSAGSSAVFTAVVANPGPNAASNVIVTESLSPAGYAATVTCEPSSGASCPGTLGTTTVISSLHAGDYLKFTYTVPVAIDKRDLITSTVQISADGDSNVANNTATAQTQAVDANSGTYTVFAADGRQYVMNVDFDHGTYTMSGNGQVWNETFAGPTNGDYTVTGSQVARLRLASDLIVGGHDFGTGEGVLPYIAARSFVTSLLQAQGAYNLATRNVASGTATTHAGTASISNNTLAVCQTDADVQRVSSCGGSLVSYSLTISGNVFTGVNTLTGDLYRFVIARSGALTLLISADNASDGTQQLRIGLPDSAGIAGGEGLEGPSTLASTGDWVTVSLSPTTFKIDESVAGFTGTATLAQLSTGGPFAMRDGNLSSEPTGSQLIYVLQAVPLQVAVGDFSHGPSGLLQITLP